MTTKVAFDLETLGRVGEALADPVRRSVLTRLAQGPGYPAELAEELAVSRSGMSNHLACLRGCGFVTATYEGRRVRYTLAHPAIVDALEMLSALPLHPCPQDAPG